MVSLGSDPLVACEVGRDGVGASLFTNEGLALVDISFLIKSGMREGRLLSVTLPEVLLVSGFSVLGVNSLGREIKVISVLTVK